MSIARIRHNVLRRSVIVVAYIPLMVTTIVCLTIVEVIAGLEDLHSSVRGAWRGR